MSVQRSARPGTAGVEPASGAGRNGGRLGDEPSLRVLTVVSYPFCGVPRAVDTARYAVQEEMEHDLPGVRAPTLLVRGDRDPMSSAAWVEHLVGLLADGRPARLPGLGHTAFSLAAETVADVVGPYLADVSTAAVPVDL